MNNLETLAECYGIERSFYDAFGTYYEAPPETLMHLLEAMGVPASDEATITDSLDAFRASYWQRCLDATQVIPSAQFPAQIMLRIPQRLAGTTFCWRLTLESEPMQAEAAVQTGTFTLETLTHYDTWYDTLQNPANASEAMTEPIGCYGWYLPTQPPLGYHWLSLSNTEDENWLPEPMRLIVTPDQCYLPATLASPQAQSSIPGDVQPYPQPNEAAHPMQANEQATDAHTGAAQADVAKAEAALGWGLAVQLYGLRSGENTGIGDFGDLQQVVRWAAQQGACCVGINPIHALFPHNPYHISPYAPSSKQFFNPLYLHLQGIEEFQHCAEAQQMVAEAAFQEQLQAIQAKDQVDYPWVYSLKRPVLERLYRQFRDTSLAENGPRAQAFRQFVQAQGTALERLALYEALQEHFYAQDNTLWGWPVWPEAYRRPDSPAVEAFLLSHQERVIFFQYLQWVAFEQLQAIRQTAQAVHLPLGLYMDLAVGCDRAGADVWYHQDLYSFQASIGAPPDALNAMGQDWGLPPMIPRRLKQAGYQPFIETLRQTMRLAGAVRIDHVLALFRLYWIPPGLTAQSGAYINYPADDLLGIVALESHRNQCVVIGEDLGTIPDVVREKMLQWKLLAYKVLYFEQSGPHTFRPPAEYPSVALATISTHDLPTLAGFWSGEDIRVRAQLGFYPNPEAEAEHWESRRLDKLGLLRLLAEAGLLPPPSEQSEPSLEAYEEMTPALSVALHALLWKTPCLLKMIQLEDLLALKEQANFPGTTSEHPNWCRRLPVPLTQWQTDAALAAKVQAIVESKVQLMAQPMA
ncbi:MAG: 4-alpha-glucanotransferase [Candidatus Melainabacteria bacterium]|nr:4-alpha-glucanotransferase [Candidatus Melainabacteria bacterium]